MKPFCEIIVTKIFPTVRALIAKELMDELNHTQNETAAKMNITQPAISQYKRELRGSKAEIIQKNEVVFNMIKNQAKILSTTKPSENRHILCTICKAIRDEKLLCKMHKEAMPSMNNCTLCIDNSLCK
ncbi:MAG: hypothetical protein K0B02_02385 [DPANN group archaeon]|nr:hypothetical protein [DPANN group archaeon]